MRLAFGDCVFDSEVRVLSRAGAEVHLGPKAFRLLELLLAQRPRVLSKDEIVSTLWPETFVSDGSLANLVTEVRAALGDRTKPPRYVRTVHRVGYSFCGEAAEAGARPAVEVRLPAPYRLVSAEREFALEEGETIVGRAEECAVRLDSSTVSRHHARLRIAGGQAVLEDLDSKNGTYVGGRRIDRPAVLANNDRLRFGSEGFTFRV
ncbi:MAG TPA: FHA domain-containing protein, partial [Vicinamibacteria bacterium]|nr:FHA domain-containing protein [Vicinamibacteria bacterium]